MPKPQVPTPQIISLASAAPSRSQPTELRQQRIDEFLMAKSLAPKTQKAYREDLARFMAWSDVAWANVTPRLVAQYKAYLMRTEPTTGKRILADSSVVRILQTFKSFLGWMARSGYIDRDPSTDVVAPKLTEPEANNLSDQQVEAILNAAMATSLPERNMALLMVLVHGLRAAEASALTIGDYDGQRLKIQQAKADSKEIVPIDLDAQQWLRQYLDWRAQNGEVLADESPLFASHSNRNQGQRMGYHAIQKTMKQLSVAVGFDFHAHQFRHTFATNLILKGMNPYHVMTLTRHKSPQNFRRYTKAADAIAAEQAFRTMTNNP
jgi:integrase/recombinase XerD